MTSTYLDSFIPKSELEEEDFDLSGFEALFVVTAESLMDDHNFEQEIREKREAEKIRMMADMQARVAKMREKQQQAALRNQ